MPILPLSPQARPGMSKRQKRHSLKTPLGWNSQHQGKGGYFFCSFLRSRSAQPTANASCTATALLTARDGGRWRVSRFHLLSGTTLGDEISTHITLTTFQHKMHLVAAYPPQQGHLQLLKKFSLVRRLFLIQPSLAMMERAFSVLNIMFDGQQTTALNDLFDLPVIAPQPTVDFASVAGRTLRMGVLWVVVLPAGVPVLARPWRLTTGRKVATAWTANPTRKANPTADMPVETLRS